MCYPKNESIIIIRKCKHFTSSSLARNDRCEHFTLSDLWRCAHEKQKNTCRKTIPSHHGMPSKWIDRSSMVCGTRHQTGNFLQLGKKVASERLCGFASVNRTQLGVPLSRATLANWIIYCAENYLCHVYDYFHRQLRMRKYLMADETRVQVLNEPERNPETDSWMWLFRSGEDGLPPILLYHYTETRAKFHAASFLHGFHGYLETDGYQGYNDLPDIKRCSCWAHVRRYFTDAIPKGKEYDYSLPAVQGVQFCSRLFDCERYSKAKNHTAEQRKQFRHEKEKPILEAFWNWLDQQRPNKGTRLAKAVNYAQNRKDTLMTYLEDGHCSLSNNLSENAIRPFTVGRRNWLFSASPKGAASSAIVYTMVEMAKANDLNTYKYLTYLLSQRPDAKMSDEQLEQLAPWSETAKANCQN